jgi:hypothetical protein
MDYLKQYWKQSKSPLYSLVFTLPLIIIYELLIFSMNHSDIVGIRNGADALFRQFFAMFGIYGFYLVGFVIMLVLFLIYYFQITEKKREPFNKQFFLLMIMESMVYAYLLRLIMDRLLSVGLTDVQALGNKEIFAMCIGAGVYEELVFRIIFLQAVIIISRHLLRFSRPSSIVTGVIVASLIFSGFHYIGAFGDQLDVYSFFFRFLAGVILAVIFLFRGYGIAVYSHAIYDLLLFF